MNAKAAQLQIRVSAAEKTAIQRLANAARLDMSAYVLSRVLPAVASQFAEHVAVCNGPASRHGLAELNSFLTGLSAGELRDAVSAPPAIKLDAYLENYIAAMVEYACQKRRAPVPAWVRAVEPLAEPAFASSLESLRLHLLTHSPPSFRRRNIFIDSSLGDRV